MHDDMGRLLVLDPADDVAIAIGDHGAVASGHKVARHSIARDAPVRRYGQIIGFATRDIAGGDHVHSHNLEYRAFDRHDAAPVAAARTAVADPATFEGYVRPDGRVGTRNYIGIIASVNCSAMVCRAIADRFRDRLGAFPNIDGIVPITHSSGCGMDTAGEGMTVLRRTLGGYARHPNFGGVLLIGLGCEANQISGMLEVEGLVPGPRLKTMTIQDEGGTVATVKRGEELIAELLPVVNADRRTTVSAAHLTVGLQCGGSDGYSGITANPALGAAVDRLVAHGGTAILSETPEIYGAEHLLTSRAASSGVAAKLAARIAWWEDYAARNGGEMDNNPSPGNKAGGLTTILEKSLGAVAKGGSSTLMDVVEYAEPATTRGLVFMDTPGYDPVSATGQVAGGANLICFTTGRGSVYGCKPTPSLKIATNSRMYAAMADDMDFNAGAIIEGELSVDTAGEAIFRLMLDTASGAQSRSEAHGFGVDEFVPWTLGAVM
ncbi:UxaA family hydrolase [Sphingomonas sp. SUN039]|uniref:UxaA family hydrolase n=1 Tax=Sphingomonas sp. SUN039 TaxID=2937787 RepID=UPI0021645382|nr:altronate dehydratase family protein [Sphingomonas sp. SUN039]UVO55766.1 altronate dehydratase family protein [Sphingomonas sp. SUN039]